MRAVRPVKDRMLTQFWPARSIKNLTALQIPHEIDIAIQKVIYRQVFDFFPADLLEDKVPWLALELTDFVEDDLDRSSARVRIFVACDLLPDCGGNGKFFPQLPLQRRPEFLSGFHLATREFPFAGV